MGKSADVLLFGGDGELLDGGIAEVERLDDPPQLAVVHHADGLDKREDRLHVQEAVQDDVVLPELGPAALVPVQQTEHLGDHEPLGPECLHHRLDASASGDDVLDDYDRVTRLVLAWNDRHPLWRRLQTDLR